MLVTCTFSPLSSGNDAFYAVDGHWPPGSSLAFHTVSADPGEWLLLRLDHVRTVTRVVLKMRMDHPELWERSRNIEVRNWTIANFANYAWMHFPQIRIGGSPPPVSVGTTRDLALINTLCGMTSTNEPLQEIVCSPLPIRGRFVTFQKRFNPTFWQISEVDIYHIP